MVLQVIQCYFVSQRSFLDLSSVMPDDFRYMTTLALLTGLGLVQYMGASIRIFMNGYFELLLLLLLVFLA